MFHTFLFQLQSVLITSTLPLTLSCLLMLSAKLRAQILMDGVQGRFIKYSKLLRILCSSMMILKGPTKYVSLALEWESFPLLFMARLPRIHHHPSPRHTLRHNILRNLSLKLQMAIIFNVLVGTSIQLVTFKEVPLVLLDLFIFKI